MTTKELKHAQEIRYTTDYSVFKHITGNRKISYHHVGTVVESFKSYPELIDLRPILVNERMEILDGQHRLEALQQLELAVPYQMIMGGTLQTVQILNGTQIPWKLSDFARSFAEGGNENYKTLYVYNAKYPISVRFMASLLGESGEPRIIKTGNFRLREDIEEADAFLNHYEQVRIINPELTRLDRAEALAKALLFAWKKDSYDPIRMLDKMLQKPLTLQPGRKAYLRELDAIYNWKVKTENYKRFL